MKKNVFVYIILSTVFNKRRHTSGWFGRSPYSLTYVFFIESLWIVYLGWQSFALTWCGFDVLLIWFCRWRGADAETCVAVRHCSPKAALMDLKDEEWMPELVFKANYSFSTAFATCRTCESQFWSEIRGDKPLLIPAAFSTIYIIFFDGAAKISSNLHEEEGKGNARVVCTYNSHQWFKNGHMSGVKSRPIISLMKLSKIHRIYTREKGSGRGGERMGRLYLPSHQWFKMGTWTFMVSVTKPKNFQSRGRHRLSGY